MKRLLSVLLIITLCLALAGCGQQVDDPTVNEDEGSAPSSSTTDSDSAADSSPEASDNDSTHKEPEYMIDFDSWEMLLVNPWTPMPEGYAPELASISSQYAGFAGASFDARAIDQLHAMCAAAAKDGVKLVVISAWRSNGTQTNLFNNKINRVMAADPSLSKEEATKQAATVVAKPGTSEHQIGLAVDFNSVEDSFRHTAQYAWLTKHCTEYGFILRYADDKQDETGIIPEPWHYRYVGVENAKLISESGLSMEEFVEKYNVEQ